MSDSRELEGILDRVAKLVELDDQTSCEKAVLLTDKVWPEELTLALVLSYAEREDWTIRNLAAELLGEWARPKDLWALLRLSRDREWAVRCSSASSLSHYRCARARERLQKMALRDRHPQVRTYAIVAYSDQSLGDVERLAIDMLERERSPRPRFAALETLVRSGKREYLDEAKRQLDGRNMRPWMRKLLQDRYERMLAGEPEPD